MSHRVLPFERTAPPETSRWSCYQCQATGIATSEFEALGALERHVAEHVIASVEAEVQAGRRTAESLALVRRHLAGKIAWAQDPTDLVPIITLGRIGGKVERVTTSDAAPANGTPDDSEGS